jgi:hypothetical protein
MPLELIRRIYQSFSSVFLSQQTTIIPAMAYQPNEHCELTINDAATSVLWLVSQAK